MITALGQDGNQEETGSASIRYGGMAGSLQVAAGDIGWVEPQVLGASRLQVG